MCGICGFTWRDEKTLESMVNSLKHRGPDGSGTYFDDRVSIGHTRLSIIDLTDAGRQPMASADGSVLVSYNGEIYNFKEIRAELESHGYEFRGNSDTEVFLYSYIEWGPQAFRKFNGMWAACVYDKRKGLLILSRDRIGVKPLYFSTQNGGLIFASEIKAILHHDVSRAINSQAVDILLSTQFIPSPMTIFQSIFKVEPRQYVTYELSSRRTLKTYYYDIPQYDPIRSKKRLLKLGRALLEDCVRLRLVADVPVGAFLSGGMDSTTVVAMMRKYVNANNLHTVSVGFDLPALDESRYIELARHEFHTRHHHIIFHEDDGEKITDDIFRIYDEPVADPSSFPTYTLCEETRKWMTVALSGDGGDEIFGGYDARRIVAQFSIIRRTPRPVRWIAHKVLATLTGYKLTTLGKLAEALRVSLLDPCEYVAEIGASIVYRPEAFKVWARQRLKELLPLSRANLTEAVLKFDIYYNRLGDNYAAKVDRISMAHSLEVRSPFLDYRFMEFSTRVPVKWKLTTRKTKLLMRELVKGLIPDQIIDREKHGFAGPLGAWIDRNEHVLKNALEKLFEKGVLDGNWYAFYQDRVFVENHAIYREYKKRLFFLWNWYRVWGPDHEAVRSTL
jgi:asparagine synthase (glutamine-hydrolysing)